LCLCGSGFFYLYLILADTPHLPHHTSLHYTRHLRSHTATIPVYTPDHSGHGLRFDFHTVLDTTLHLHVYAPHAPRAFCRRFRTHLLPSCALLPPLRRTRHFVFLRARYHAVRTEHLFRPSVRCAHAPTVHFLTLRACTTYVAGHMLSVFTPFRTFTFWFGLILPDVCLSLDYTTDTHARTCLTGSNTARWFTCLRTTLRLRFAVYVLWTRLRTPPLPRDIFFHAFGFTF